MFQSVVITNMGVNCSKRCQCRDVSHCDKATGPTGRCACKEGSYHPPYCVVGRCQARGKLQNSRILMAV